MPRNENRERGRVREHLTSKFAPHLQLLVTSKADLDEVLHVLHVEDGAMARSGVDLDQAELVSSFRVRRSHNPLPQALRIGQRETSGDATWQDFTSGKAQLLSRSL